MRRFTGLAVVALLAALVLVIPAPSGATVIGIPGNPPVNLPAGPSDPNLPGFNLYPFILSSFISPSPNPLPSGTFAESPTQFNLVLLAGFGPSGKIDPIVATQTFNFFVTGDYWSVQAQFQYAPDTGIFHPSDVVTMQGDAVHRIAPHPGEVAPGPTVPFNVTLNAGSTVTLPPDLQVPPDALRQAIKNGNLPAGARFGVDVRSVNHPFGPHDDLVFGLLAGQIASPNNPFVGNDLEFWIGGVGGLHTLEPTPEPTTFALLGSTLAGLGLAARRRRLNRPSPSPSAPPRAS